MLSKKHLNELETSNIDNKEVNEYNWFICSIKIRSKKRIKIQRIYMLIQRIIKFSKSKFFNLTSKSNENEKFLQ